jgi:hypothetical protein
MLAADKIKPFLIHEEECVREAAALYFSSSWSPDPELLPFVLKARELFGDEANLPALLDAHRFALTTETFPAVLNRLAIAESTIAISHLNRIVANAPLELLRASEELVSKTRNLYAEATERILRRRELALLGGEELWRELEKIAKNAEDEDSADADIRLDSKLLIAALARYDIPDAETIRRKLDSFGDDITTEEGWLKIFLINLAGERRLRQTIPCLVGKLSLDDVDYAVEAAAKALAKIGDAECSWVIRERFDRESWGFRVSAADLLGKIKCPESEEAALALLASEKDLTIRTFLCQSLCDLFSETGLEAVAGEIQTGYDPFTVCLEESALTLSTVAGIEHPDAESWRAKIARENRIAKARRDELDKLGKKFLELKKQGIDPFAALGTAPETYRRETPKAGRNDPCPCGSGKKHKKCCG